jgi:hypothetical protein
MSDIDDIDETIAETEEVLNGVGDSSNGDTAASTADTAGDGDGDDGGLSMPDVSPLPMAAVALASPVLSVLPGSWRIYHKINQWSAYRMQKAAGADGVANVLLENGHEDLRPAKWVRGDADEKEGAGWKIKGLDGRRYDGAVDGRSTTRYGKADMLHLLSDGAEVASWAEPAMDNAIQLGRERYLFRDAQMLHVQVEGDQQPRQALADGGARQSHISVEQPGVAQDCLIPVSSRAGYDGQMVSWNRYTTLKEENADQDKIRDAKNAAWTAAKLDDIEGMDILKWMIIIGIWSAILLFHQDIGAAISGLTSGGGGGGGAVGNALGMITLGLGGL